MRKNCESHWLKNTKNSYKKPLNFGKKIKIQNDIYGNYLLVLESPEK